MPFLRCLCAAFNVCTVLVVWTLLSTLRPTEAPCRRALRTASVVAWPVHAFFGALYYSDAGATLAALGCYTLALRGAARGARATTVAAAVVRARPQQQQWWGHAPATPLSVSQAGAVAVLFRQTNVVWVAFSAVAAALEVLRQHRAVGAAAAGGGGASAGAVTRSVSAHRCVCVWGGGGLPCVRSACARGQ